VGGAAGAIEAMEETAGGMGAVEEAMHAAEKHEARSEKLAALVAEARELIEQARAAEAARATVAAEVVAAVAAVEAEAKAERARVAAEEAAVAAAAEAVAKAAEAAKRQQLEEKLAALALEVQQVQAELGSGSGTSQPDAEETLCVVCMDAPKDHIVLPCMHMCACEACAQLLRDRCPVCRGPIQHIAQVFT
jgi:hypothetical protein